MNSNEQLGLLEQDKTWSQEFDAWKSSKYGAHLLNHLYRVSAGYGERYMRTGRRVSVKLIFELVRDRLPWIRSSLIRRGIKPTKVNGFSLNNCFTAAVARHIMSRRPEFQGMFELREIKK